MVGEPKVNQKWHQPVDKSGTNWLLEGRKSPQVIEKFGGRTRTRTLDPLIKSQLLYQLSYAPHRMEGGL